MIDTLLPILWWIGATAAGYEKNRFWLGFFLGFFLGVWGILIIMCCTTASEENKGI